MKVEVKEIKKVEEKPFPKLMVSGDCIVYMIKARCGVALSNDKYVVLGYDEEWIMSKFTDFNDSITLSND